MRLRGLGCVAAAALGLASCHPKPLSHAFQQGSDGKPMKAVAKLTCPQDVGDLSLTAQAADGKSCAYTGPQGERVDLTLQSLDGMGAQARLAALDTQIRTALPQIAPAGAQGVYIGSTYGASTAHIDLPGFHLNATNGGASIRMPGININADGDNARVQTGFAHNAVINAHSGGAEIRTGGSGPEGVSATYLLASDRPGPSGDHAAGYVAKGPAGGPLVVAVFHMSDSGHGDAGGDGVERLVNMNVHGDGDGDGD